MSTINVVPAGTKGAYSAYGGCLEFLNCKDHQVFLYGGAGSGKTTAACHKMMALCMKYPGVKFLFTRKSYRSLIKSGVETFENVLRLHGWEISSKQHSYKIHRMGEAEPREFRFPYAKRVDASGRTYEGISRIVLAPLARVYDEMGAEYDFIYVNQPEQITEDDWQFLASRANGRRGMSPYPQLFGDPNPEHEKHWIKLGGYQLMEGGVKEGDGRRWRLIKSTYHDNPIIWDQKLNCFTKTGEDQIGRLIQSLNSVMAKRLIEGDWCSFEGLVYADIWNKSKHIIPRNSVFIDDKWKRFVGIDFGHTAPFVAVFLAKHPDKELYICYRQIYMTGRTTAEHAISVRDAMIGEPRPELIVADRDPERISILSQELGMNVISAKKHAGSVKAGIDVITDMLKNEELLFTEDNLWEVDEDLRTLKKPIGFEEEVDIYRWDTDKIGEAVIGENDHALDAMRYITTHIKANRRVVPFIWQ